MVFMVCGVREFISDVVLVSRKIFRPSNPRWPPVRGSEKSIIRNRLQFSFLAHITALFVFIFKLFNNNRTIMSILLKQGMKIINCTIKLIV